jgi:hypothetical protein
MNREAGIDALVGMGVAIQMMALGAVFLVLRFIWRKLFGKTTQKKLKAQEDKPVALESINKNKRFNVNSEQVNQIRNENEVDAYISRPTVSDFSESTAKTQVKRDFSPKENVEDESSPEYTSLDKKWSVARKYQPELIGLASRLSEISPKLSHEFKSKLIESKSFVNASSVSDEVFMDYLNKTFGPNEAVITFAKKIIVDGFNNAAEELKQAVNVFGKDIDAEFIINKIQRDFSLYHYGNENNNQRTASKEKKEQEERKKFELNKGVNFLDTVQHPSVKNVDKLNSQEPINPLVKLLTCFENQLCKLNRENRSEAVKVALIKYTEKIYNDKKNRMTFIINDLNHIRSVEYRYEVAIDKYNKTHGDDLFTF